MTNVNPPDLPRATRKHLVAALLSGAYCYCPRGVRGFTMAVRGMARAGLVNVGLSTGVVYDYTTDRYYGEAIEGFSLTAAGRAAAMAIVVERMVAGLRTLSGGAS